MPFVRMDPDAYDAIMSEMPEEMSGVMGPRPSGEFEYSDAVESFVAENLGPVATVALSALRALGATEFRVRYDGGCDEGFAYPDSLRLSGDVRTAAQVANDLAAPELIARIREAAARHSVWYNATEMYGSATPAQAVMYALDELAGEMATMLLGEGFGTGECELYGAFTANLDTGELVDDPNATKPEPS